MTSPAPKPDRARRSVCALCASPATRSVACCSPTTAPHGGVHGRVDLCDACEPRASYRPPEISSSPPASGEVRKAPRKRDREAEYRRRKAARVAQRAAAGHAVSCSVCLTAPATRLLDWGSEPGSVSLCDACEPGRRRPTDVEVSLATMGVEKARRARTYLRTPKPTGIARHVADATGLPLEEVSQLLGAGRTPGEILEGAGVVRAVVVRTGEKGRKT